MQYPRTPVPPALRGALELSRETGLAVALSIDSPWTLAGGPGEHRAIKRDAVLLAAAQLFNEHGYHATSLAMVAKRLAVTKPTLYYYVQNKEEILFECVRLGLEMLRSAIAAADAAGATPRDKLEAAMHAYALIVTREFGRCLIRVGEDPLAPASRRQLRLLKAEIDHEFRALIEQGMADGSIEACDPKLAAFTLAGALSWIGRWFDPLGSLSADEVARHSTALLMRGLTARAPPVAACAPAPVRRRKTPP